PSRGQGAACAAVGAGGGPGDRACSSCRSRPMGGRHSRGRCRRGSMGSLGAVCALMESELDARAAIPLLQAVAGEVLIGLGLRRRIADGLAFVDISEKVAHADSDQAALGAVIDRAASITRSDGAKVYLLRDSAFGPCIERIHRPKSETLRRVSYSLS